jgi:uncharacterized protein YjgD (DUF1641 family)
LIPGVLVKLPSNGKFFTVAAVHTVIFTFIFFFTHKIVDKLSKKNPIIGIKEGHSDKEYRDLLRKANKKTKQILLQAQIQTQPRGQPQIQQPA